MSVYLPEVEDALAALLAYPDEGFAARAAAAGATLRAHVPALASALAPFLERTAAEPSSAWEELYTRTFDWAPERALEIGWHLYGEQYDRGAFLVRLRDQARTAGVEEGQELPDHLTTVLRLLPRLPSVEAEHLATAAVAPALARLEAGFGEAPNPYRDLVRAIASQFPPVAVPRPAGAKGA